MSFARASGRGLAALALLLLAAAAPGAELRIGLSADVTTFDPHFVAAQPNLTVAHHVFESLLHVDERGVLERGQKA